MRNRASIHCLMAFAFALAAASALRAGDAPPDGRVISRMDKPFLFSYLAWKDKVKIEGGRAIIRGVTNQGGAGVAQDMDLSAWRDLSPALRLRVGEGNQADGIALFLKDADGRSARWDFSLKGLGKDFATVVPTRGGSLLEPDQRENGEIDLARVTEWQLIGNWAGNKPMDLEVEGIVLVSDQDAPELAKLREERRRKAEEARRQHEAEVAKARAAVAHTEASPWVESVYTVAPDVLAVAIRAQEVVPAHQEPYAAKEGDEVRKKDRGSVLVRGGKEVAWVIGPKRDTLTFFEGIQGDPLLDALADLPETYRISSQDDPSYAQPVTPSKVDLKSKPTDWAQPIGKFPMRHIAYLRLPHPLAPGKSYAIDLSRINVRQPQHAFVYAPEKTWSEAVHVNQIGFRPDDPVKRGFLSLWLGTGGRLAYPKPLKFSVLDDATGKPVFEGNVEMSWPADRDEELWIKGYQNYNKTDVYRLDFAPVTAPGIYRVCVEGIGCSFPFPIARDVWEKAFVVQMKGFYNQRSGIALGPPWSDYKRPRDFFPGDGVPVYQSTYSILEGGDAGKGLEAGKTDQIVPEAWGGYHDAGDWNPRRVTHMRDNTDLLLELLMLFPDYFGKLDWPLPRDYPVPPMLNEILFEVDCFRRLQLPSGAVRFGIETHGDPISGEVSWNQSMPAYVFAPDPWSGFIYASVAARAASVLGRFEPKLAAVYRDSALKAMVWSEAEWAKIKGKPEIQKLWRIPDDRNFAAVELYRLTRDRHWLDVFLEDTVLKEEKPNLFQWGKHVQQDAALAYALLPDDLADPALRKKAVQATAALADLALAYAKGNAFNLTASDNGKPLFLFFFSVPQSKDLVRAHYLTGETKYLAGAVQAALFSAGANPANTTYTVGVGTVWPHNPLKLDARWTGQKTPIGQTVYGNCDFIHWKDGFWTWPITWYLSKICRPSAWEWPVPEAFFDVFLYVSQDEYTVDGFGQNAYAWGYLAARPAGGQ